MNPPARFRGTPPRVTGCAAATTPSPRSVVSPPPVDHRHPDRARHQRRLLRAPRSAPDRTPPSTQVDWLQQIPRTYSRLADGAEISDEPGGRLLSLCGRDRLRRRRCRRSTSPVSPARRDSEHRRARAQPHPGALLGCLRCGAGRRPSSRRRRGVSLRRSGAEGDTIRHELHRLRAATRSGTPTTPTPTWRPARTSRRPSATTSSSRTGGNAVLVTVEPLHHPLRPDRSRSSRHGSPTWSTRCRSSPRRRTPSSTPRRSFPTASPSTPAWHQTGHHRGIGDHGPHRRRLSGLTPCRREALSVTGRSGRRLPRGVVERRCLGAASSAPWRRWTPPARRPPPSPGSAGGGLELRRHHSSAT